MVCLLKELARYRIPVLSCFVHEFRCRIPHARRSPPGPARHWNRPPPSRQCDRPDPLALACPAHEIAARDSATSSEIAQALQFSQATITTGVDRLQELGFVLRQRNGRDKRQFILSALPPGRAAPTDASDWLQTTFTARFDRLPSWEQAMILAAVERLAMLMDAQNIDAAPLLDSGLIDRSPPV